MRHNGFDIVKTTGRLVQAIRGLLIDFWFHELRQLSQTLLPAEIAGLERDYLGNACLFDRYFRTNRNSLQDHRDLHLAWQIRIVEPVGVDEPFSGNEFQIFAAERMAVTSREIAERHAMLATDPGLQFVDGAEEPVGRQPACHRVELKKGPIDLFGSGRDDAAAGQFR